MWDFTRPIFRKFEIFGQVELGPTTWAHINGYIDTCKYTEILFQQFLKVKNQNDSSFVQKPISSKALHKN